MLSFYAFISKYVYGFWQYVIPRLLFSLVFFAIMAGNLDFVARIISNSPLPFVRFSYDTGLIISGIITLVSGWLIFNLILDTLGALGYRGRRTTGEKFTQDLILYEAEKIEASLEGLEISSAVSHEIRKQQRGKYRSGDPLSALGSSHNRIEMHIARLQNNAAINLVAALIIAGFGIAVLASAFLEIEKYQDRSQNSFKISEFLVIAIVPRLSISIFVQIFSYFFLLMYRSNLQDVRYFENEITNIDFYAAATSLSMKNNISPTQRYTINRLLKVERNRILNKNQKVISSIDDEQVIERLSRIDSSLKNINLGKN